MRLVIAALTVTVCVVVLSTTWAMIAYAPAHGVNVEIADRVYRIVDVILGALLGGAIARKESR